jgi:type IV pilus assembly protein PilB
MSTQNIGGKKKNFLTNISSAVRIGAKGTDEEARDGSQRPPEILFEDENYQKPKAARDPGGEHSPPSGVVMASSGTAGGQAAEGKRLPSMRLQDVIIKEGVATKEIVEKAFEIQRSKPDKRRLIDIAIDDLGVDREALYTLVARHYSFETVDPTGIFEDKEKLRFIRNTLEGIAPRYSEMAVKMKIIPYEIVTVNGGEKIVLITPDTTHPEVHTVAKAFGYQKYEIKYVALADFTELWRQLTFDQGAKALGLDTETEISDDDNEKEVAKSLDDEIGRSKLNDMIENLLVDGTRTGASDIHVIPRGSHRVEFHFRIDGRLSLWSAITDVRAEAVLTVIKDRAKNLDRFEKLLSQDGFAQRMIDNRMIRFRFSTMPIYGTDLRSKLESIVIRILRGADAAGGLGALGMPKDTLDPFLKAIRKPQGMVIFTGPTGSGKSTSQLAAIQTIMDPGINILTIEDPVEYLIEGVRQVKLNHKLDFEGALRGILRHDPDVVMVGEMRDKITADLAVKLANTGHLIFSTLHTNDSIGAITRLYNMGIEPFLLAYTVNIVVAQRLIRKLCERCKVVDEKIDNDLLVDCGFTETEILETKFFKPVGCVHCIRGFRGRIGIYETLLINKELRRIILRSQDLIDEDAMRQNAVSNGMKTLKFQAIRLVKEGITSLDNVEGLVLED